MASKDQEISGPMKELGEREFIRSIVEGVMGGADEGDVLLSFGDDAAVLKPREDSRLVVTQDAMIEGTHFLRSMKPEDVGFSLAAANLSDLAAMGGAEPAWAVLTFGAPPNLCASWAQRFFRGLAEAAGRHHFRLIGGDTVRAPQMVLSLTMMGQLPPGAPMVRRSGAQPGDTLYLTGSPGESAAGLRLELEPKLAPGLSAETRDHLRRRHFRPEPRLAEGRALAAAASAAGARLAMLDISDGVFNEAGLIAEASGGPGAPLGAEIELAALPISPQLAEFAEAAGAPAERLALFGGEDFELMFASDMPPAEIEKILGEISEGAPAAAIGRLTEDGGVRVLDAEGRPAEIEPDVFHHFSA